MEAGLDNANATNNPFANSNGTEILQQKEGLLLNLTEGFKQNGAELSPSNEYVYERPANGKRPAEEFDEDEDMGPETDVDVLDDALSSPILEQPIIDTKNLGTFDPFTAEMEEKVTLEMELNIQKQQTSEFEPPRVPREETPTPPAHEVHDVGLEENVAESGEDSEDEWNYYKGDSAESEKVSSSKADQEVAELTKTVLEEEEEMSQLNPNAAEFVPISSPTRNVVSPACRTLLNDQVIAQSPRRSTPSDIDINLPNPQDFEKEVKNRPSDVYSNGQDDENNQKLTSQEVMENLLNGKNIEDIEFHPSTPQKATSPEEFHFGPNATPFSTPAKFLDQSEALSTKAVFGDDSTTSFLEGKTLGFETSFTTDVSSANPFTSGEGVHDFQSQLNKPTDPMSMSFYQDENDANPFDLNKVQMLPDDDDFLEKPSAFMDETISDLPEHDPLGKGEPLVTDLDKPAESSDILNLFSVSKLPENADLVTEEDKKDIVCDVAPSKSPILIEASRAPLPITPEPDSEEQDISSVPKTPDAASPLPQEHILLDVEGKEEKASSVSSVPPKSPSFKSEENVGVCDVKPSIESDLIVESNFDAIEEQRITPSALSPEPTEELNQLSKSPEPTDDELCQQTLDLLGRPDSKSPTVITPEPTEELLCQSKSPEPEDLNKSPVPTPEPTTELCEDVVSKIIEKGQEIQEEFFPISQKSTNEYVDVCEGVKVFTSQFEDEEVIPVYWNPPATELSTEKQPSAIESEDLNQDKISPEAVDIDIQHQSKSQLPLSDDIETVPKSPVPTIDTEIQSKSPIPVVDSIEIQSKSPLPEDRQDREIEIQSKSPVPIADDIEIQSKSPAPIIDDVEIQSESPAPIIDDIEIQSKSPAPIIDDVEIPSKSPVQVDDIEIQSKSPVPVTDSDVQPKSPVPPTTDILIGNQAKLEPISDFITESPTRSPEPITDTAEEKDARLFEPTIEIQSEAKSPELALDALQEQSKFELNNDPLILRQTIESEAPATNLFDEQTPEICPVVRSPEPPTETVTSSELVDLLQKSPEPDLIKDDNIEVCKVQENILTPPEPIQSPKEMLQNWETSEQVLVDELQGILDKSEPVVPTECEAKSPETIEESLDSEKRDLESPMEDITSSVKDDNSITPEIIEEAKDISTEKGTFQNNLVPLGEPQLEASNTNYTQEISNAMQEISEVSIEKETVCQISSTPNTTITEQVDTESVNTADVNSFLERSNILDVTSPLSSSEPILEANLLTEVIKTDIIIPQYPEETVITPSEETKAETPTPTIDDKEAPAALPEVALEAKAKEKADDTIVAAAVGATAAVATAAAVTAVVKEKKTTGKPLAKVMPTAKKPSKLGLSPTKTTTTKTTTAKTSTSAKPAVSSPTKPVPTKTTKPPFTLRVAPAPKPSAARLSPKPKTDIPATKLIDKKPLMNGDLKASAKAPLTARKPPTTTAKSSVTAKTPAAPKPSPTKTETKISGTKLSWNNGTTKSTTTTKTTAPAAPKPRPTTLSSRTSGSSSTTKTTSTVSTAKTTVQSKTSTTASSPKSTTAKPTRPPTSLMSKSPVTNTAPKPRVPSTRTSATKGPDTEKQIKDSVNKQLTASRSTTSTRTTGTLSTGKTTTTVKKTESKSPSARTMTTTKTTITAIKSTKKPGEVARITTKKAASTKTTPVKAQQNGLTNGITTIVQETTTILSTEPQLIKDLSPVENKLIVDNSQLTETNVAD